MIANWLPEDFLKATILFELQNQGNFNPHCTGVLVNFKNTFILVTCKHIVINSNTNKQYDNLHFLVNKNDGTKKRYNINQVQSQFKLKWHFHKNVDVDLAVSPIAIDQGIDDIKVIPLDLFEDFNTMPLGDDIFFLGYPLGIGTDSPSKVTPLVRSGIIASKNANKSFYIDANVYPGSSGSPVFYRPTAADLKNGSLGSQRAPKFLGIVSGNRNYQEYGMVLRTHDIRVLYEENAGLGAVYSSNLVKEILETPTFKAMITRAAKAQQATQRKTTEQTV